MSNFIDYEFCLMTDCKTDISVFTIPMIYGLVSEFLIHFMCTDVSAFVTHYKNLQWSIALQCFPHQGCGRKVRELRNRAAVSSREGQFSHQLVKFLLVNYYSQSPVIQRCRE